MDALRSMLFFVAAFALGTRVDPWFQSWQGSALRQGNVMQALLGDGRRMFANHFFAKADAYFHSGYYPTVFDNREAFQTAHMAADAGALEEKNAGDEHEFLGPPHDWIEALGRKFYPSEHTHLDEGGACDHDHDSDHVHEHAESAGGTEREILPWLKLSVELDPSRVESYVVAAYWLRERLGRVDEAEQFLREGLRANPDSYEILYEMGRSAFESRKNPERARRLWHLALRKWERAEAGKAEPDYFMLRNILSMLSRLEEESGHFDLARHYLENAAKTAPDPSLYDRRLKALADRAAAP